MTYAVWNTKYAKVFSDWVTYLMIFFGVLLGSIGILLLFLEPRIAVPLGFVLAFVLGIPAAYILLRFWKYN
jgi:hypothetical protein